MSEYGKLKNMLENVDLPCTGVNELGEILMLSDGYRQGGHFYRVETYQENNWIRINIYWEDGTIEELFRK